MTISPPQFPAVTVTVVRDRKIRTALRTTQIAGFVTVPSWKKIKVVFYDKIYFDLIVPSSFYYRCEGPVAKSSNKSLVYNFVLEKVKYG